MQIKKISLTMATPTAKALWRKRNVHENLSLNAADKWQVAFPKSHEQGLDANCCPCKFMMLTCEQETSMMSSPQTPPAPTLHPSFHPLHGIHSRRLEFTASLTMHIHSDDNISPWSANTMLPNPCVRFFKTNKVAEIATRSRTTNLIRIARISRMLEH